MSARIRNKEAQMRLAVDGRDLEKSFLKVTDWEVTPQVTIEKTSFTGESRPDADTNHQGYDFSFTIQELGGDVEDLVQLLDELDLDHKPVPNIMVSVYRLFRQPGEGDRMAVYENAVMKCDSQRGEGSSYINSRWSGFAPTRKIIAG